VSDTQTFCWTSIQQTDTGQAHHAHRALRCHTTLALAPEDPSCMEPGPLLSQAATSHNPIHQTIIHQVLAVNCKCTRHLRMDHNTSRKWDQTPGEHYAHYLEGQVSFRSLLPFPRDPPLPTAHGPMCRSSAPPRLPRPGTRVKCFLEQRCWVFSPVQVWESQSPMECSQHQTGMPKSITDGTTGTSQH